MRGPIGASPSPVSCCGDFGQRDWWFSTLPRLAVRKRVVDFVWPAVVERGMTSPAVVEPLDVGDDIPPGLRLRRVNGPVDALVLQRRGLPRAQLTRWVCGFTRR